MRSSGCAESVARVLWTALFFLTAARAGAELSVQARAYCDPRVGGEQAYERLIRGRAPERLDGMAVVFLAYCAAARGDVGRAREILSSVPRFRDTAAGDAAFHLELIVQDADIARLLRRHGVDRAETKELDLEGARFLAAVRRDWSVETARNSEGYPTAVRCRPYADDGRAFLAGRGRRTPVEGKSL